MGKRKMHAQTYFQCDWTGLPMRQTNCYMPDWNETGKLVKYGSYTCWEAVVAHAVELNDPNLVTTQSGKLQKVREYINSLVGCNVKPAPHWSKLAWFNRDDTSGGTYESPKEFLTACCDEEAPVVAVRMMSDGTTHEVMCSKDDVVSKFAAHLTKPFNLQGPIWTPQSFQTVRKKTQSKERDLTVFYWPFKNGLPFNQTASNLFKMQIYGDILMVQQTKEPCFLPRERYINYFNSTFLEQFPTKSKRKESTLTTTDYAIAKEQMVSELQHVEQLASACASEPGELAKASVCPPPSGKELADLLRAQGVPPPAKAPRV